MREKNCMVQFFFLSIHETDRIPKILNQCHWKAKYIVPRNIFIPSICITCSSFPFMVVYSSIGGSDGPANVPTLLMTPSRAQCSNSRGAALLRRSSTICSATRWPSSSSSLPRTKAITSTSWEPSRVLAVLLLFVVVVLLMAASSPPHTWRQRSNYNKVHIVNRCLSLVN